MRVTAVGLVTGWLLLMGCPASLANELAGTTWRIETVKDAAALDPTKAHFVVDAEGWVSTTVGCNRISGKASIAGSKLSFGPFASTRMACEPALMDLEQLYIVALDATRSFRIEGMVLKLMDEPGAELVRFIRVG